jgi:eukaryotic-like serine/threonine-protein kinase
MPIRTTCPECQAVYELADHLGGKRVLCAECRCTIQVAPPPNAATPADDSAAKREGTDRSRSAGGPSRAERRKEDEDRSRRRVRRLYEVDDEGRPPRRRASQTPVALIVGLVAGGVALLVCAGCGVGFLVKAAHPKPQAPLVFGPGPVFPQMDQQAEALDEMNRGIALKGQGRDREAEAAFREAIRLRPNYAEAHANLSWVLNDQNQAKEAEREAREAIRAKPTLPEGHFNLGNALDNQRRYTEAEAAYREAVRQRPAYPEAHCNLAKALIAQGRYKDAEAPCREAIRFQPELAVAHFNLGTALLHQGRNVEAEAALREAIRLRPDDSGAHNNLGCVLGEQGRWKEAEAADREAILLKPDDHLAQYNLGNALYQQLRYDEAEAPLRKAIQLKGDYAIAHCKLGQVLRAQGRFAEALTVLRRGHELGSKTPGWSTPSARWISECERLVELDGRLPVVLAGNAEPAGDAERVEFVSLCVAYKHLPVAGARIAAATLAEHPGLTEDQRDLCLYDGACGSALAAAGRGEDARQLPDKVVLMLRRQALRWLREDLALYARQAKREGAAVRRGVGPRLAHWQRDTDLAAVRDREELDRLPDDERREWLALWNDVAALRRKVEGVE